MRRLGLFVQAILTPSLVAAKPSGRTSLAASVTNNRTFFGWPISITTNSSQLSEFSTMHSIDPVLATATELQSHLENGSVTSAQLVDIYLTQIEHHNLVGRQLRALASVPSRDILLERAEMLDMERASGKTRGPFHGIPITLKDAIITEPALGMSTEVGSYVFRDAIAKKNAELVNMLLAKGLIIIGKASLTEFCGQKGEGVKTGWSATNGQAQSAYVKGGASKSDLIYGYTTPGGSSSGSAIGISAGFTPLSIGTENDGSAISPANRAGLYALKLTHGSAPTDGVFRLSSHMDCLAGMAKSTADLALLLEMMLTDEARQHLPPGGFKSSLVGDWKDLSVGFVDPSLWRLPAGICPEDEEAVAQQEAAIHAAMKKIADLGARVEYPVLLPPPGDFDLESILDYEFAGMFHDFADRFQKPKAKNLQELIAFNKEHADLELPEEYPSQSYLEFALHPQIDHDQYVKDKASMRQLGGPDGIDRAMKEHQVDVIIAPSNSPVSSISAAAGYPIATVPLGIIDKYKVPFGISVISTAFAEVKLLKFMSAFEATFPKIPPPPIQEEQASL
ncbi:amidase signature domain-containing protein [Cadophora sp. MPI-SDFR-AT-0126]|nr:amidase signature domain-containing protein [Leotiomycetes sp. MPI-SDFR-AT-0126]